MRKGEFAMRAQNLTLLTDLYELTMMQGYYENPSDQIVVFDAFYSKESMRRRIRRMCRT